MINRYAANTHTVYTSET